MLSEFHLNNHHGNNTLLTPSDVSPGESCAIPENIGATYLPNLQVLLDAYQHYIMAAPQARLVLSNLNKCQNFREYLSRSEEQLKSADCDEQESATLANFLDLPLQVKEIKLFVKDQTKSIVCHWSSRTFLAHVMKCL